VTATILAHGQPSQKPSATDKVAITGWALNMSNIATGANQTIQIDIDGWSNPSQRQHLIETFLEKKQDGLVRELEKQPDLGRFRFALRHELPHGEWRSPHRDHHAARDRLPGGA